MAALLLLAASTFAADGEAKPDAPADAAATATVHPFLKKLIGDWVAEGDLTGQDGNVIKVKEEWKGEAVSEGTFVMEGKREINNDQSDYKWTITHNAASGTYEAAHDPGNGGEVQRFEGSLSDVTLTMELTAQLGGGSMIKLVDTFSGEGYDTLETEVTFTNDKGEVTLSGKITHKRVKKG